MENQEPIPVPKRVKIVNGRGVSIDNKSCLQECLKAFNELPNKRLKNNIFPDTHRLAQNIELQLENLA